MNKFLSRTHTASLMMAAGVAFTLNFAAAALISVLTIGNANATIVGGEVTGGLASTLGGVFEELTAPFVAPFPGSTGGIANPDGSVGDNNFQSLNLYAFDEDQNITLTTGPLSVDTGGIGGVIANGQTVASHYVFFDPSSTIRIKGFVDFDAPIIGVATSTTNLDASDGLQNSLVTYLNPGLRGLEGGDSVTIAQDSSNLFRRLVIDFTAGSPGDYVRVFTQFSPGASVVPLPAALPLYGTGLAIMSFIGWRRKQRKAVV